ncbi:GH92 family glycosyl hydrolase [Prevotella sp. E13-17]|uniref:GH92 family glycosyl hydrolase n=1 Tax=Prevotella sp. E13-17 TaxID=2913616 RepID=UPI001ED9EFE0|nr:GH92 family glycosyl hydrolase [Prevotella sp. E13-17]UKK51148.1 GH92 family glycosyl hydrolase [Prevotella sp. E13-17]
MKLKTILLFTSLLSLFSELSAQCWQYVDPRIGSVGVGRTFPGPCMPFGMVKPGPDCGVLPNAGWAEMPAKVTGFSQTHVSGTGGGQKYGNILILPCLVGGDQSEQARREEQIELGYYATTFDNGIRTEITTDERCAYYRFHYPNRGALLVDVTHFLGKNPVPNLRERQQFVGADFQVVSDHEVQGFSCIRGGWNNGGPYTVFFALRTDRPFKAEGNLLTFSDTLVNVKIGISYVGIQKAQKNIGKRNFNQQLQHLRATWEQQLSKISIEGTEQQKRMFYTALYHTMLMPVDKTGENPRWKKGAYYDDYYAIWDTYRTSSPLLTLLCPDREVAMVNALLNIYQHEGYMPDARSGDCNGRTQGGSNADVVVADAMAKGLKGIDYRLALEAMLKDGEVDAGSEHEKHGRGGLNEYIALGYIPYGIPRAGTRTVEYAFNDWCIAQVAKRLGDTGVYQRYMKRSENWKNLWRKDYIYDGMCGFIMPKDAEGQWLDSVPWGHSQVFHPTIAYTPTTKVAPWYVPWWDTFFYEATSEEYSLSIPHDVEGLIEACGGKEAFKQRLDLFFEKGYYNVQNEPSFLSPCLYHWIGRPDLSTQRIHQIINNHYTDLPDGLPGNDDSGAMSSWLAFHMMGLYPLAGTDTYLLNLPLLPHYRFTLPNGQQLEVERTGDAPHFAAVTWNGRPLPAARITHQDLLKGGKLHFTAAPGPAAPAALLRRPAVSAGTPASPSAHIAFTLNRQYRSWPLAYSWRADTLVLTCKQTTYHIPRQEVEQATTFCWLTPQQDGTTYHAVKGTFAFISQKAYAELRAKGAFVYDTITWRKVDETTAAVHVKADIDATEMWIEKNEALPLVLEMRHNPLGIDWTIKSL